MIFLNPLVDPHWERLLGSDPAAGFFHSSWWCRTLAESYGYQPLYPALGEEDPERDGFIPLMEVASRITGRRAVGLPFSDECAPLERRGRVQTALPPLFEIGRQKGWRYVELRGPFEGCERLTESSTHFRHRLSLSQDEESMLASFSKATRRNIRKGLGSPLKVRFGREWGYLREFHRLQCHTRRRHGLPPQPESFFRALHRNAIEPGHGLTTIAECDGKAVAGAVFLFHGKKAYYKYGASLPAGADLRGNHVVMWNGIRQAALQGCETFCFGRTEEENEGLRRYKRGWGTVEDKGSYYRYDFSREDWVESTSRLTGLHNHVFSRIPVPALRLIGAALYRHMA